MRKVIFLIVSLFYFSVFSQIPTAGLVGAWNFSGNANDASGSNNHGTVSGASLISDRCGNPNSAYHFNGSTDFIQMLATGPTGTVSRSLSYWVRSLNQNLSAKVAFDYGTATGAGDSYQMVYNYNCVGTGIDVSNQALIRSNACLMNGVWHHVVAVYNSSVSTQINGVDFYIDGILQPVISCNVSGTTAVINTGTVFPITIGVGATSAVRYFDGDLDDFYLYNRVLTPQEVQQLYTACSSAVNGPQSLCPSVAAVYSVMSMPGATYSWTLSSGWTGSSTTNTILVTPGTTPGTISASYNQASCNFSATASVSVAVGLVTITAAPVNTSICSVQSNTIIASGGTSYTWQPGFWTGSSLIVNPTITTVYTVTGMASNNCTNTAIAMVSVSKISSASSASAICKGQTATLTASGGGTYTWQPGTSGGGSSIVVSPSVTTVYTVTGVANNCTNTSVSTITVTLKNCTIGIEEQGMEDIFFSVFPNPTKGKFHLKTTEAAALKIINNLGQIVYESKIRQEEYVIDLSAEPAGIYFVQIQSKRLKTVKLVKE